eukprot:190742_1
MAGILSLVCCANMRWKTASTFICLVMIATVLSTEPIYISKNGSDQTGCGESLAHSCGTLYYVSKLPTMIISNSMIIVHDGQNPKDIEQYFNKPNSDDDYNPCLPVPFNVAVEIIFNETFVKDMNDWYPQNICDDSYNFLNKYMFWSSDTLTINNLIINNFMPSIGFIMSKQTYCNQCIFTNIITNTTSAMFNVTAYQNLYLRDNIFINIESINDFIFIPDGVNTVQLLNSSVINSRFSKSFIYRSSGYYATEVMMVDQCIFSNISVNEALMYFLPYINAIHITNTFFQDIKVGYIVESSFSVHHYENITIESSRSSDVSSCSNEAALFIFNYGDAVIMNHFHIEYTYNFMNNCHYSGNISSPAVNGNCYHTKCNNPIPFIINRGQVNITNISFHINITLNEYNKFKQDVAPTFDFVYMEYKDETVYESGALILNYFEMNITELYVDGLSFSYTFISNFGSLLLDYVNVNISSFSKNNIFEPNALQSSYIIKQTWWAQTQKNLKLSLSISNSHFIGASNQIYVGSGSSYIYGSTFQNARQMFYSDYGDIVVFNDCKLHHIGPYYGSFNGLKEKNDIAQPNIFLVYVNKANITNTNFSCYGPGGFVLGGSDLTITILLMNNTFIVDDSDLVYNVSSSYPQFLNLGLIYLRNGGASKIINNNFHSNHINASVPWIYYGSYGNQCLSGNNFSNFAFALSHNNINITSCFRPNIINCLYDD